MLWVVLANVSGGNWKEQSSEWQDAAARWRDYYFAALRAVKEVPSETTPRGLVMGQGPGPGQRVVINFEMRLYVSKGPGPKRERPQ